MPKKQAEHKVGKRKTSIARVYMKSGSGKITINGHKIDEYYLRETSKMVVRQPLELTNTLSQFDVDVNVCGGGLNGQAGAIRHGIARVLSDMEPEYRKILKVNKLLTRDARKKERKMYGRRAARAKYQFSKR